MFVSRMSSSHSLSASHTENWQYSSGGRTEDILRDWSSELFGQEPLPSDPAFEYYEQGSNLGSEDAISSGDEPPSVMWDLELSSFSAFDYVASDMSIDEESMGEHHPLSEDEYLEFFGEPHPNFNRVITADSGSSSSEGEAGEVGEREDPLVAVPFQPNHPSALRQDALRNSLAHAAQPPDFFCCVCSQILYRKEAHPLRVPQGVDWHTIDWPCRHYGTEPTMIRGMPSACQKHKVLNNDCYEFVSFFF
jgi:hypothetical protein